MIKKLLILPFFIFTNAFIFSQVHTSYLWHLQQPIYWPDAGISNQYHFQTVKESQDIKNSGGNQYGTGVSHPTNNLEEIFSKDDRRNVYQHVPKESVQQLLVYPDAGAQVNYSGCLIDNVNSLADAGQWGYYSGWQNSFIEARNWQTSGGFPRLDIVSFTYHHALSPLISERALSKEIEAHKEIYGNTFGTSPDYSKGYWPAECAFSERIIKVLKQEGIEWTVVANSHLSRTLNDYPLHYGTNGCNISPPNKADIVSTNGINWWNGQIDGRGGEFAAPYCYQAHKAKYVDPETGTEYIIDVVPMADLLSYKDGYSPQSTEDIDNHIAPFEDTSHPSIVLFAHDGDNAWGGGSSYYFEAVPNFVAAANSKGYIPTTIQQFLYDNPVPENDIIHVEDGSWVNAANDWGHPQFINWLWPLYNTSDYTFNPDGWTEDARNWAVITAIDNFVCMAEDLAGSVNINKIVYPVATASNAELAWHFYMPALTSGYMYYGKAEDMEVKQTIAGNNAISYAQNEIDANPGIDNTPPSVFIPQRFPYNPGGKEFGPIYGYREHISSKDFTVWTYGFDVSGISSAILKYRTDNDGINPVNNNENDTYAGGSEVSSWHSVSMTSKILDTGNVPNDPEIDFFVLPDAIANLYYAKITGLSDTLVDYYVEMTDTEGNIFKTPIQHVYIGNEEGGSSNENVYWTPEQPTMNDQITISSTEAVSGSMLHWGVTVDGTNWIAPISEYWTDETSAFDEHAVETPFTDSDNDGIYTCKIGPFNNSGQTVDQINFVIKIDENTWDNNNGQDYHISINNNPNDNPVGSDEVISMMINETYTFSSNNFYFQSPSDVNFNGIRIISEETNGNLKYNGTDITASADYPDVSLLTFTPNADKNGAPYATFTFKIKDDQNRYSDDTYLMTVNVFDYNPLSSNNTISLLMNSTYTFAETDFPFTGMNNATFNGIQLISDVNVGSLLYNGSSVPANTQLTDISLLTFTPLKNEYDSPYTSFTFKVIDSEGRYSNNTYTMTINVIESSPEDVSWIPELPDMNDQIIITVNNDSEMDTNGKLHWGINKTENEWTTPIQTYWPSGTADFGDGHSVETPFTEKDINIYQVTLGPFNDAAQIVNSLHFVLHYGNNTWNNNNNEDWNITINNSTSIQNVEKLLNISIFPNPVKNFALIKVNSKQKQDIYIKITDINGKVVKSQHTGSAERIKFKNNLSPGIYIFHFTDKITGQTITKKIVTL